MRFEVLDNGSGGFSVWDSKRREYVGSECSHLRNAEIKASRLNQTQDLHHSHEYWCQFYGAHQ